MLYRFVCRVSFLVTNILAMLRYIVLCRTVQLYWSCLFAILIIFDYGFWCRKDNFRDLFCGVAELAHMQ